MTKTAVFGVWFNYDYPGYYIPPTGGCYIGVGSTPSEAAEDCIEAIFSAGHEIDENEIMEECPADYVVDEPDDNDCDLCCDGPYWYCAVRLADGE
jgi:hypothetical protein